MRYTERKEKIQKLEKQLELLKSECNHPESQVDKKDKGSRGNWDPSNNRSWTEHKCNVCSHWWTIDHE